MERIYTIIQREKMRHVRDEILAVLDKKKEASTEENFTFRNREILNGLNEILRDLEKDAELDREGWDFSREKTEPDFAIWVREGEFSCNRRMRSFDHITSHRQRKLPTGG